MKKSSGFQTEAKYLKHIVSAKSLKADLEKAEAVDNCLGRQFGSSLNGTTNIKEMWQQAKAIHADLLSTRTYLPSELFV